MFKNTNLITTNKYINENVDFSRNTENLDLKKYLKTREDVDKLLNKNEKSGLKVYFIFIN